MFFNFCMPQGYFVPQIYPIVKVQEKIKVEEPENHSSKIGDEFIDLTEKDHIEAGYDKIKNPWSEEEDKKLRQLREIQKYQWTEISQLLPGRNPKMCYSRYKRLEYNPREHWKESEDELLRSLVEQKGEKWALIAPHFKNRTLKQMKDHYLNYLKFEVTRDHWNLQEDMLLVKLLNTYGRNWKQIQKHLKVRTQNQIKNRYFGRIKKLQEKKEQSYH